MQLRISLRMRNMSRHVRICLMHDVIQETTCRRILNFLIDYFYTVVSHLKMKVEHAFIIDVLLDLYSSTNVSRIG